MGRRAATSLLPLVVFLASCDPEASGGASKEAEPGSPPPVETKAEARAAAPSEAPKTPTAPAPTPPADPAVVVVEPPPAPAKLGLEVEHRCDIGFQHIELTAAIEIEQLSWSAKKDTVRTLFEVACVQCEGELYATEGCKKKDSWTCAHHVRMDLTALDRGEPLRPNVMSSGWYVEPIERPKELKEEVERTLSHIDDPAYYTSWRTSGEIEDARSLLTRIHDLLPSLEASPVRRELKRDEERTSALLEIQGNYRGVLWIADGKVRVLTYEPLGIGEASCEGLHRPSPDVLLETP